MSFLRGSGKLTAPVRKYQIKNSLVKVDQNLAKLDPCHLSMMNTFRIKPYPQSYPVLIVRGDGSSYRAWSMKEPHEIVRFPINVSKMSEIERTRLLSKRYGKTIKTKFHTRVTLDEDDFDEELGDFDDITQ